LLKVYETRRTDPALFRVGCSGECSVLMRGIQWEMRGVAGQSVGTV